MSQLAIQKYLNEPSKLKKVSGTQRETVVREAFKDLLKDMARTNNLVFLAEHKLDTPAGAKIYVDGALVYDVRLPFGYWEAKDQEDDIDEEIEKKFAKGYPQDNISRNSRPRDRGRRLYLRAAGAFSRPTAEARLEV